MLRNDHDSRTKQYAIYSAILHAVVFACGSLPVFLPRKNDKLLMDIELAGEGELREALNNQQQEQPNLQEVPIKLESTAENRQESPPLPEIPLETSPESNPTEENKSELPPQENVVNEKVEEKIEQPKVDEEVPSIQEEPKENVDKNDHDDVAEEKAREIDEPKSRETDIKEEPVHSVEKELPKDKPEDKPVPEKSEPKKKKRDKKAMMDVIKKAEKKKVRDKSRKKFQEIIIDSKKRKKDEAFSKMLNKSIADMKKNSGKGSKGSGWESFGSGNGLTEGDLEMISSQIYPHWVVPSGVRDAENIVIEIQIQLKDNGEVIPSSLKILDEKRYATDYIFRAAADSARRAILEASPLKIPRDKVDLFRDFILRFNLREALGG